MRKTRRAITIISVILTIILAGTQIVYASNQDYEVNSLNTRRLNYWYSDVPTNGEYKIGRFDSSTVSLQVNKENININFHFSAGMQEAKTQWANRLNITINSVSTSASSADIRFWGGTSEEVNALGIFNVNTSVNGMTVISDWDYDCENWIYGGTTITGVIHKQINGYVLDKGRSAEAYIKTCAHELGHALGWRGHSSVSTDVMYGSGTEITTLSNRDKLHLAQVYNRSDY